MRKCFSLDRSFHPVAGLLLILAAAATAGAAPVAEIHGVVPANWPTAQPAPVVVPLATGELAATAIKASLIIAGRAVAAVPAEVEPADPVCGTPARAWFLWAASPDQHGRPITVRLEQSGEKAPAAIVARYEDPVLKITAADGKPVLNYWHGQPAAGKKYPLNDFIHPLMGLDGESITDLSPQDHQHHRGVFWAWVRNERKGEPIGDWWIPQNIHADAGDIRSDSGCVFARFSARHYWVHQPEKADKGERFMDEQIVCRVFPATPVGRAIDLDLSLTALDEGVRVGGQTARDKGYGGMSIRYAKAEDVQVYADGQRQDKDMNRLKARWADWAGRFILSDGKPAAKLSGTAIFVHPSHPDFPPEWITRIYGFLNPSYPSLPMLPLRKGQPLRLRYRLWVHRGDVNQGEVDVNYRAYAADWKWDAAARDPVQAQPAGGK